MIEWNPMRKPCSNLRDPTTPQSRTGISTSRSNHFSNYQTDRNNGSQMHIKLKRTLMQGQRMIWQLDLCKGSSTAGVKRKVILSGEQPMQLYIPSGVAHGYKAGLEGATLLYAMDQQFNLADPNEGRLAWNFFGADLWSENRG
jgi:dTDP-4-dehydrorhamnose 3,5-epimerase